MKHTAEDTGKAYAQWVKRFILFHGIKHPLDLDKQDVEALLSHLATDRNVAASTQNKPSQPSFSCIARFWARLSPG